MEIAVVGVNHKKAPVEVRERLAFDAKALASALDRMRAALGSSEEVILSTCNRVELYFMREGEGPDAGTFLGATPDVLYRHSGAAAVRHLFEVTSGLDSMVVGETQIIAQVKQAYFAAKEAGHTGRVFNPLFQRALAVAKQVHATTAIGERSVSVSSVTAKLAEKIFQDLAGKRVLILGAGDTAALTLAALRERGVRDVMIVNRTVESARALGTEAYGLHELDAKLGLADIVVACLTTERPVVTVEAVRTALKVRRNEPMFLIDIAVPRNVDAEVNRIDNVYLFNIDDLQGIVNQNLLEREREVAQCAPLIEAETDATVRELAVLDVRDVLTRLRHSFEAVGDEELKRTLAKLTTLTAEQRGELETMVHRLISKLLHNPTTTLKDEASNGHTHRLIELAARLFGLK